jgi:hypothetical protein
MTEVIIDTAGPSITVRSADDLDTVAAKAMELFRDAMALYPLPQAVGPVGFVSHERANGPEYVSAHPIDLRTT